jgi:hypothetical protein
MVVYIVQGFVNIQGVHTGVQVHRGGLFTDISLGAH